MCTYASAALAELYGLPAEQFHGSGWLRAVASTTERERVWASWQYAVKHGTPYEDIYTVIAHGKPLRIRTYTRAVRDAAGVPLCYFGIVTEAPPDSKLVGGGSTAGSSSPPPPAPTDSHKPLPPG
jgi:PAS domain-containing protein